MATGQKSINCLCKLSTANLTDNYWNCSLTLTVLSLEKNFLTKSVLVKFFILSEALTHCNVDPSSL